MKAEDMRKMRSIRRGKTLQSVLAVSYTHLGSSRWIRVLGISIQPAEIAKIALIIFIASSVYLNRKRMDTLRYGMLPPLIVLLPICVLLYFQPNYSAIIVLAALTFIMMFVGGVKGWHLAALGGIGVVGGVVLMVQEPYRVARLASFMDPWQNPTGDGYQVIQSLYLSLIHI